MKQETKQIDGYWVIGKNKWNAHIFTKEQAEKYAATLINCENCIDCSDCSGCSYCSGCLDCRDCSYFKTNQQRITSPTLGSRKSQTTYHWNEEKEEIICGCFKGTLEQFRAKVKETHGDNEFAQGYLKWIDAVKFYKLTYGGNK